MGVSLPLHFLPFCIFAFSSVIDVILAACVICIFILVLLRTCMHTHFILLSFFQTFLFAAVCSHYLPPFHHYLPFSTCHLPPPCLLHTCTLCSSFLAYLFRYHYCLHTPAVDAVCYHHHHLLPATVLVPLHTRLLLPANVACGWLLYLHILFYFPARAPARHALCRSCSAAFTAQFLPSHLLPRHGFLVLRAWMPPTTYYHHYLVCVGLDFVDQFYSSRSYRAAYLLSP